MTLFLFLIGHILTQRFEIARAMGVKGLQFTFIGLILLNFSAAITG